MMTTKTSTPETAHCPDCGAPLYIDEQAEIGTTIYRQAPRRMPYIDHGRRKAPVAFCTGCEFSLEIRI